MKTGSRRGEGSNSWFPRAHGQNNTKTSNPEELRQFEYRATERITKALNATKENGTAKNIEKIDKFFILKKRGDVMKTGDEQGILMEQIKTFQQSINK